MIDRLIDVDGSGRCRWPGGDLRRPPWVSTNGHQRAQRLVPAVCVRHSGVSFGASSCDRERQGAASVLRVFGERGRSAWRHDQLRNPTTPSRQSRMLDRGVRRRDTHFGASCSSCLAPPQSPLLRCRCRTCPTVVSVRRVPMSRRRSSIRVWTCCSVERRSPRPLSAHRGATPASTCCSARLRSPLARRAPPAHGQPTRTRGSVRPDCDCGGMGRSAAEVGLSADLTSPMCSPGTVTQLRVLRGAR